MKPPVRITLASLAAARACEAVLRGTEIDYVRRVSSGSVVTYEIQERDLKDFCEGLVEWAEAIHNVANSIATE